MSASMTAGALSYLLALLAYLLLAILLVTAWRGRLTGLLAVVAVVASLPWAAVGVVAGMGVSLSDGLFGSVELARNGGWFLFLTAILVAEYDRASSRFWNVAAWSVIALGGLLALFIPLALPSIGLAASDRVDVVLFAGILEAVFGLLLVEQVFRNRLPARRWEIKHLCLGLGAVFVYDLFFYSDGLLMQHLDEHAWEARGLVNALIVPLIAVSAARNPAWSLDVHVSRSVVFHSATLSGAGLYLMAMAAAGYWIRLFGGAWSAVLQIVFLFSAGVLLLLLLFSGQLRARARVWVSRHFFSFKYDYREEWLRFTEALSQGGMNLPRAVVGALGEIVDSPTGMLWARHEGGDFELLERNGLSETRISTMRGEDSLVRFLERSGWIVEIDEWRRSSEVYENVEMPDWLRDSSAFWLLVPLVNREELCGFVVLGRPRVPRSINWEDRALLKTAGRQAASHVARYLSDRALMRARQFEAFNQLSAYVAHDLKNLLAQQSLILSNAERHKQNPAFVEDVLQTIRTSVDRMNRLMAQLRTGVRGGELSQTDLEALIRETIDRHADRAPIPRVEILAGDLLVNTDKEQLRTIVGHILQNAREATGPDGSVVVRVIEEAHGVTIEIEDDGVGMSDEFIRDRLFRPFDSTKGLTGMGIGAFEAREMVRRLGGELAVESKPGRGTLFRVYLPRRDIVGRQAACVPKPSETAV